MIVSAALCPSPPLLARDLTGQADVLPELRAACAAAVTRMLAAAPDIVAVVGPAPASATWDPAARLNLAAYAPAVAAPSAVQPSLPLALGIGALLLDEAGYSGPRLLHAVAESASPADCARLGRELAGAPGRTALLAVGDGTARRSLSAPGYFDERAEPFDAEVERALRDADLAALGALDQYLAADLMATNRAALQVLAAALPARPRPDSAVLYSAAPLGVAYLIAALAPAVLARPLPEGHERLAMILEPDGQLDA